MAYCLAHGWLGCLQEMAGLLARLKAGGHKCLIFTQMSKLLDVLEVGLVV